MKEDGMIKVKVRFFGGFNGIPVEDEVIVPKGTEVRLFLEKLVEQYGSPFREQVWSTDGKFKSFCKLFLVLENKLEEISPEDLDREVSDELNFFSFQAIGAG